MKLSGLYTFLIFCNFHVKVLQLIFISKDKDKLKTEAQRHETIVYFNHFEELAIRC
jgi:hypothetical protein